MSGAMSVISQEKEMVSGRYNEERTYWINELRGQVSMGSIPADHPERQKNGNYGDFSLILPDSLGDRLFQVSAGSDFAAYVVLMAALSYLIYRYQGKNDFLVGMPPFQGEPSQRHLAAIRSRIAPEMSFKALLNETKKHCIGARKYKNVAMEPLLAHLSAERTEGTSLFQTMAAFQGVHEWDHNSMTPINFIFARANDNYRLHVQFCSEMYEEQTIRQISGHLVQILQEGLNEADIPLRSIHMLTETERQKQITEWNFTDQNYDSSVTLSQLFEDQVERTPNLAAIWFNGKTMTYRSLNERANRIACMLRMKGVTAGHIVGLMLTRSFDMLAGLLGILKAGAAYLPIDPDFPSERIRYMLEDSGSKLLLTEKSCIGALKETEFEGEYILLDLSDLMQYPCNNLQPVHTSRDLAYVIYTSGSTGKPKGVMLEHRSVHNFVRGIIHEIGFEEGQVILNLTTISFDIFVLETIVPLACGMTVAVAPERAQKDPAQLCQLIEESGATIVQMTPSRLQLFLVHKAGLSCFRQLTDILIGGEAFPPALAESLNDVTNARIYNMYGPTETTVWSAIQKLRQGEPISLGSPIVNTQLYIVNKDGLLQPVGVEGELCIGGDGLARGYWRREELTQERFVPNPYVPGTRMYRTGDMAKRLPDGRIEFLGRKDHQVKIRGYRIELGEIEQCLLDVEGVSQCAAAVKTSGSVEPELIAYYTGECELSSQLIRTGLAAALPEYMIPGRIIYLKELPMTLNGKLDRGQLPDPDSVKPSVLPEDEPSISPMEAAIRGIWTDILARDGLSVRDNFFEVGGNSSLVVKMHAKLELLYPGQTQVADLFTYPTIAELARFINDEALRKDQMELSWIEMPDAYLSRIGGEPVQDELELAVSGDGYEHSVEIASVYGADTSDLVAAAYIYTLAEAADCEQIAIEYLPKGRETFHKLQVDFAHLLSAEEMIKGIQEQRSSVRTMLGQRLKPAAVEGKSSSGLISAAFAEDIIQQTPGAMIDIILRIERFSSEIRMIFECGSGKLSQDGLEKLVERFTEHFQNMINLLSGKEEMYA